MPPVTIYTKDHCPYCTRAKELLDHKGIAYQEVDITSNPHTLQQLVAKTQHTTVPQIFIGKAFVGGYDELAQLNEQGKLHA